MSAENPIFIPLEVQVSDRIVSFVGAIFNNGVFDRHEISSVIHHYGLNMAVPALSLLKNTSMYGVQNDGWNTDVVVLNELFYIKSNSPGERRTVELLYMTPTIVTDEEGRKVEAMKRCVATLQQINDQGETRTLKTEIILGSKIYLVSVLSDGYVLPDGTRVQTGSNGIIRGYDNVADVSTESLEHINPDNL